ncbi:MAG: hypothetical protein L0Y58_24175 [Verrucomicrobia subdivision 3 bacterium]|nr:hypothetical protein [Limisphaerales bacterium]
MESLGKVGDIAKQHFEKLILIVTLAVLGGAVVYLYMESQNQKEKIREFFTETGRRSTKPVKPAELTNFIAVLEHSQAPPSLDLGLPHNVLNPVKWQRIGGQLIKIPTGQEAVEQIKITDIRPLNFSIAFDRSAGSGYWINVTNEVQSTRRQPIFATLNTTNTKIFILRDIRGAPESPEALTIELKETGERITISTNKPYVRPQAYEADLRYPLENKNFTKLRVGAQLRLGGEDYTIVTITQNEVVLLAGNDKKYTIRYQPGAAAGK